MRKIYILLLMMSFGFLYNVQCQDAKIVISGVMDGPLPGGLPKVIELYVRQDIADLSVFAIGSANNGGGTDGPEFAISGMALKGEYLYIATETAEFTNWFGFGPNYTTGVASINGDDAIELFENGSVIDVFGDINVDGTNQPWEYLDGWAYRTNIKALVDGTFDLSDYSFSGKNALDGETSNASAAVPFPAASLPVTLQSFKVVNEGEGAKLIWITVLEISNSHFELLHSTDGNRYNIVGRVEGAGFSAESKTYSFDHENLISGIHYYKLRQVDFDGRFEEFDVRTVEIRNGNSISIYPTAVLNELTIKGVEEGTRLEIYTLTGQQVAAFENLNNRYDTSALNAGTYMIRIGNTVLQFIKL